MPEGKRLKKLLLLFICCITQLVCAISKLDFDNQLAALIQPLFPSSQKIKVLANLNPHQESLINTIQDKNTIELVSPKKIASHSTLLVKFRNQDKSELLKFAASIEVFENILTTKRAVSRKEKVSSDNCHYQIKDIFKISGQPFILSNGNYCYNNDLVANQPLTTWQVSRMFDVKKYDRLNALVTTEGITLKITVTALQSGFIGDKIPVKFPSGKKAQGTIEDMQTIKVRI